MNAIKTGLGHHHPWSLISILEGFRKAEQQHDLRYINFIGDGDSSVHTTLISGVSGWGHAISKQEYVNHAVKCYRSSLENLVKD